MGRRQLPGWGLSRACLPLCPPVTDVCVLRQAAGAARPCPVFLLGAWASASRSTAHRPQVLCPQAPGALLALLSCPDTCHGHQQSPNQTVLKASTARRPPDKRLSVTWFCQCMW